MDDMTAIKRISTVPSFKYLCKPVKIVNTKSLIVSSNSNSIFLEHIKNPQLKPTSAIHLSWGSRHWCLHPTASRTDAHFLLRVRATLCFNIVNLFFLKRIQSMTFSWTHDQIYKTCHYNVNECDDHCVNLLGTPGRLQNDPLRVRRPYFENLQCNKDCFKKKKNQINHKVPASEQAGFFGQEMH